MPIVGKSMTGTRVCLVTDACASQPMGGVTFLDKGGKGSFTADLSAGDYGLICFVPDAKDGKPHFVHGMMKTIKVG